jgi:malonate-semialdehyde dehydrogenase (acetylating)/methylmalonate-semialdehyde dehydrogenase
MIQDGQLLNYINGTWQKSTTTTFLDVRNPATAEALVRVPLSSRDEVGVAVDAAQAAFPGWRATPATQRIQYLFRLKELLEANFDEIARLTTDECGKTFAESQGELRRGIENIEVACGIPILMQGYNSGLRC